MLPVHIALTLGSRLYDSQCVGVRLRRTQLPAVDRLEVMLPVATEFDAEPGEDCSLELDGGEGASTVFTGRLTRVIRGLGALQLVAHNGGYQLARLRPAASFEKLTVGEIIDQLCSDAEVAVGRRVDGPTLAIHAMDGRATAAEEIARLGGWAGARAAFDGEGQLHVTEEGGPSAELALRHGRELVEVQGATSDDPGVTFTVVGEGAGDPGSPEARWVVTDFLKGGGAAPSPKARRVAIPALRSKDDADLAAGALSQSLAVAGTPVRLTVWLHPGLQPGMRLELSELPESVTTGECRIRQVISTVWPGRAATTDVWATAQVGSASDFGGLAGLAGGLL